MKTTTEIATQLFDILHQANLSDATDENDQPFNDLHASASRQDDLFGHIADALKSMGYLKQYSEYCETGDLPDLTKKG